MTTRD